jgi:serine phosphatase RsbU (regulator of sigma subunit)
LVAAFHLASVFARHPSTMLRQLNAAMLSFVTRHKYEEYFATALVCCFRPQEGYVEYASAGSEPPMIASRAGVWTQCLTGDIVLGVETDANYKDVIVPFGPGSTMVAFTDGVSESKVAPGRENEVGSVNVARAVDDSVLRFGSPTARKILAYVDALNAARYEDDATLFVASAVA